MELLPLLYQKHSKRWTIKNFEKKINNVAALFVENKGVYSGLKGVDAWDIKRNALNYNGPYPVVAHPPCKLWGKFAKINYLRWGGEHNKPGNDGGLFEHAVRCVRKFGGVLEHPACSYAWESYKLTKPEKGKWTDCGDNEYVCEVYQSVYGHLAAKKTWLFYKGRKPFDLNWKIKKGIKQIGFYDQRGKKRNKPTLNKKESNATPVKFRNVLLKLARYSAKEVTDEKG